MKNKHRISVIIPLFNEEKQVKISISRIIDILKNTDVEFEFILIDDGSYDNTWGVINELSHEFQNINGVKLSRNFGKESAIFAGIELANADACVFIDADMQHPPEILPQMIKIWKDENYHIVEGVKTSRGKEGLLSKINSKIFYKTFYRLSGFDLANASDYKLIDNRAINVLKEMNERETFFRGMSEWIGFKRKKIKFQVQDRVIGSSKWSFLRLLKLAINAITSFSSLPLQLVTFMGTIFLISSLILTIQTLYMKFIGKASGGFTTVIILILITGSTLMISQGIIGIYLANIYNEIKFRPRYVVSEQIKKNI